MPKLNTIGGDGRLFLGTNTDMVLELLDRALIPVDMTGMTWRFSVKASDAVGAAEIFGVNGAIEGIYNASRAINTQRMRAPLTPELMVALAVHGYHHSWRRTDDGSKSVGSYGPFIPQNA